MYALPALTARQRFVSRANLVVYTPITSFMPDGEETEAQPTQAVAAACEAIINDFRGQTITAEEALTRIIVAIPDSV